MQKEINPKYILSHFVFAVTVLVSILLVVTYLGNLQNLTVGCEGTDYFFTGEGFYVDYIDILYNSTNSAGLNYTDMSHFGYPIRPPSVIKTNEFNYDCDTISNAIYCLASKYNKTCKFLQTIYLSEVYLDAHGGILCFNEVSGIWEELY